LRIILDWHSVAGTMQPLRPWSFGLQISD